MSSLDRDPKANCDSIDGGDEVFEFAKHADDESKEESKEDSISHQINLDDSTISEKIPRTIHKDRIVVHNKNHRIVKKDKKKKGHRDSKVSQSFSVDNIMGSS